MKKLIISCLSLSLLNGAIAGKDDPIHQIPTDVKVNGIFSFLTAKDTTRTSAVDKTFNAEVNVYDHHSEIYAIYKKGGSFARFFNDPNSPSVRFMDARQDAALTEAFSQELFSWLINNSKRTVLFEQWIRYSPKEIINNLVKFAHASQISYIPQRVQEADNEYRKELEHIANALVGKTPYLTKRKNMLEVCREMGLSARDAIAIADAAVKGQEHVVDSFKFNVLKLSQYNPSRNHPDPGCQIM